MATAKPDLPRDGTMQVTAKEGIDYLKSQGKDTLLEMQGLVEQEASGSKSLPRDSTMEATAKEAEEYILAGSKFDPDATTRGQQKQKEEEAEEKAAAAKKPKMAKGVTMAATAKEAKTLLADTNIDPDASTRGQQKKLEEIAEEEEATPAKKPKMAKGVTMAATAKEAKELLAGATPDADAMTRGQQKKIEEIQAEKPSPKKAKMSKQGTMAATAKEGAALLAGEKLQDSRTKTKGKPSGPKRSSTIQKTMDEAKWVLQSDKVDINEGRKTRSASKPKPPPAALKKAGTMQKTAKEGKEFLKRGRKPKKAAASSEDAEES